MLLVRVVGRGRAAELLDGRDELLALDRFFRRLNLAGDVEEEALRLSPSASKLADAYSDGVNQALGSGAPLELRLARHKPDPWTVADTILTSRVVGYVALAQTEADMERLVVELVQGGIPARHLEELFPGLLDGLDESLLRRVSVGERLVPAGLRWGRVLPPTAASNCWAVAPSRTASGRALLANDPHLEVNRLPAVLYEAVLQWADRFCIGATIPGIPGVIVGRTNDLAWGVTYSCMDAHDYWIEQCERGRYMRVLDGRKRWLAFNRREEVIKRKGRPDVRVTFFENDHGVLDGDAERRGLYLAGRWSAAARTGARSLEGIFAAAHAGDVRGGMEALGSIETAWNWVLADSAGNVGHQMSGLMPERRRGHRGMFPLPGWDPGNDWRGFVPAEDLPRALNPRGGFVANANDDVNHLGKASPVNLPMGSHRVDRITELLGRRRDWTVAAARELQLDVTSGQARRYMSLLRPLLPNTPQGRILSDWDCTYDADSRGAYLFERFYRRLIGDVFGPVCGDEVVRFFIEETGVIAGFYDNFDRIVFDEESVWWAERNRDDVLARVAAEALRGPTRRWGEHQSFRMSHVLLGGRLPSWLGLDLGPFELPGARATVRQGQTFNAYGRRVAVAASLRFVTDFGEHAAYTALAGGPSDRRWSRWYRSDVARWRVGGLKRLSLRRNAREGDAGS
jgi:penicillin amidase